MLISSSFLLLSLKFSQLLDTSYVLYSGYIYLDDGIHGNSKLDYKLKKK